MRSVAMTAYQGMPYIGVQLESILLQLREDDELVISDNGSTDGTLEYLQAQAIKDARIQIFTFADARGVIPNLQNALMHCRGEIIFLSDQDDIWKAGKLDRISELFESDKELLAVQGDAELIDSNGNVTDKSFFELRKCGPGVIKNFTKNTWQGCSMAFRRSLLTIVLPFPKTIPMHDMWIGILAELTGKVRFLPEIFISYRRHDDNQTKMKPAGWNKVILWRLCLAGGIIHKLPQIRNTRKLLNRGQV